MKRRNFLKYTIAGPALLSAFPFEALAGTKKISPSDRVMLGSTGIETSRMAIGTGTDGWGGGSNQTRKLGINGMADMLKLAFDEGITFWDSADQYGTHPHLKEALKRINRDKVVILTKTNSRNYKNVISDLERFRKEIGVDTIDIILLHAVTDGNWNANMKGAMDALSEAKEKGIIRAHGISCHSIEALQTAASEPWVEVDLARFNPGGVSMDADIRTVREVLSEMKKNGKSIINMKIYGAGRLVHRKDECLQYHTESGLFDGFTIGIESIEELRDIQSRLPLVSGRG
jgi:1-deoxyxylulose-5-phosphate synthase